MYGFGYVWVAQGWGKGQFYYNFKRTLRHNLLQEWYSDINESSKAYHYKDFKCILEGETYLSLDMSIKYFRTFSKFRCTAHHLFVETG